MSRWFVMLYHPAGYPTPVVDESPEFSEPRVVLYDSEIQAEAAMRSMPAAVAWGWEAYEWPA